MPAVTRVGDNCTGHDDCPPVPLVAGSGNVFVNGKPVCRIGDPYETHSCPVHSPHTPHLAAGASNVFVNGIPVSRIGDAVDCGGSAAQGSPNVFVGDGGSSGSGGSDGGSGEGSEGGGNNDGGAGSQGGTNAGEDEGAIEQGSSEGGSEALSDAELTQVIQKNFEALKKRVEKEGDGMDALMLCLPKIAKTEAGRHDDENDKKGWNYLHDMLMRWLTGKANEKAENNSEAFWVSRKWLISYKSVVNGIDKIKKEDYLFSDKAKKELINILKLDNKFTNKIEKFDYIMDDNDEKRMKRNCFQFYSIDSEYASLLEISSLFAAMGDFTLRAVAKGFVVPRKESNIYEIKIDGIGVFTYDTFNFDGFQYLGCWSCEELSVSIGLENYCTGIFNSDFVKFRKKFNVGNDFVVISKIITYNYNSSFICKVD